MLQSVLKEEQIYFVSSVVNFQVILQVKVNKNTVQVQLIIPQ